MARERTESDPSLPAQELREPAEDRRDAVSFEDAGQILHAEPLRYSRLLRLARGQNPKNSLPDKLCGAGLVLYVGASVFSLLFWGVLFMNRTAVMSGWMVLSLAVGLPVFLAEYIRMETGAASWQHRFRNPTLSILPDRLVFELTRQVFGKRVTGRYRWTMPYRDVRRMEYDRSAKTLRIYGKFDPSECRLPGTRKIPDGMRRQDSETASAERNQFIELPMVFPHPERLLPELQNRTGCYIHPAVRGDDLIDLRDLPGQEKERARVRPIGTAIILATLLTFVLILWIRGYYQNHPFEPFPKTEPQYLQRAFEPGETVVLDGCEITLQEITRVGKSNTGEVCYSLLLTFLNHNEPHIIIRTGEPYRDSESNIALSSRNGGGETIPVPATGPPRGFAGVPQEMPPRLEAEKSTNVNLFFYMPQDTAEIVLSINSDYWAPRDVFRDVHYTGGETEVQGQTVKDNEIRFRLPRELFE